MTIPNWNAQGLLPPINEIDPTSADRSPYEVPLATLVARFATSQPRIDILDGFLRHRAVIHATGLTAGFQWIDGSFLEHIELSEKRPPGDIDVVTFYLPPAGTTVGDIFARNPQLFTDQAGMKTAYHVDGYFQNLAADPMFLAQRVAYWYSMWSHRREMVWKGYLQVPLDPNEDRLAYAELFAAKATI